MAFETEINGQKILIDAEPDVGGEDLGPRPKPFMLAAPGGGTFRRQVLRGKCSV
jgi:putative redox protein